MAEKWREVPKLLKANGLIRAHPDYDGSAAVWKDFIKLIDFRDGLVHARASLPYSSATHKTAMPEPTVEVLDSMEAGWPTRAVVALVRELHTTVGTEPPR